MLIPNWLLFVLGFFVLVLVDASYKEDFKKGQEKGNDSAIFDLLK